MNQKYSAAYLLVLPAIVLRAIFTLIPLVQTVYFSFTNKSLVNAGTFVGLKNYINLASDNTMLASIAILLTQRLRGRWLSNFIMLLPWVMAPLLAATVFKILYFEDGGILNEILRNLGLTHDPVRWLSDSNTAKFSVILTTVWKNVSWVALIFMAGLGSLSQEVSEAAAVDGADAIQRFWFITLPLLKPSIYLVLMFRGMGEVQTFEQIYGLTRGGPGSATQTLAVYAYQRFFQELRYGYGSAINVLLLVLTIAIGGVFAWLLYRSNR